LPDEATYWSQLIFRPAFPPPTELSAPSPAAASAWTWCATKPPRLGGRIAGRFLGQPARAPRFRDRHLPLTLAVIQVVLVDASADRRLRCALVDDAAGHSMHMSRPSPLRKKSRKTGGTVWLGKPYPWQLPRRRCSAISRTP
jgi:hypothetical protein